MLVVTGLAVACSGTTEPGTATIGTTVDRSTLGPDNKATGSPIKIGFIVDGKTAAIDTTGQEAAANAAAKYVNDHLGGVKGRPIEIEWCYSLGTPAGSADCANKMIVDNVPIVLGSTPASPAPIVSALGQAGVPYFLNVAGDSSTVLAPNASVLTNTLGNVVAPIVVAKEKNAKRISVIIVDLPAAVGPFKGLAEPLFTKEGIESSFAPVPLGTPDMTPQVQAELSKNPDMFVVLGEPSFCTAALSAMNTLGFQGTKYINSQCMSPDLHSSVSGGIGGVLVGATASLDASDPEVALYLAAMATYAPEAVPNATATPDGWSPVLAWARAMNAGLTSSEITPQAVTAAFAAAPAQPMPLFAGQTFKCDRSAFKLTPAVCTKAFAVIELHDDGTPGPAKPIDVSPIVNG
jgi:branched-chain amino acid transport system substrate-binding protein